MAIYICDLLGLGASNSDMIINSLGIVQKFQAVCFGGILAKITNTVRQILELGEIFLGSINNLRND